MWGMWGLNDCCDNICRRRWRGKFLTYTLKNGGRDPWRQKLGPKWQEKIWAIRSWAIELSPSMPTFWWWEVLRGALNNESRGWASELTLSRADTHNKQPWNRSQSAQPNGLGNMPNVQALVWKVIAQAVRDAPSVGVRSFKLMWHIVLQWSQRWGKHLRNIIKTISMKGIYLTRRNSALTTFQRDAQINNNSELRVNR